MDTNYGDIYWDLFKRFGGIDAYICYSEYKKVKKTAGCADAVYGYEHI